MGQSLNEVDDLTRFADESFNTDEVDLFEFTGVDDSPLTRLKSVILSLDWEITDDILDELTEEVSNLRTKWEGDKVAQVYLQGIDKVGTYLRQEGAYAHPNAIKLLLTLFYNYEKIISSPDISGDEITTLLKSDVRKFKVLQYQIGNTEDAPQAPAEQLTKQQAESEETGPDLLSDLSSTILGLEWEVTEEGLDLFSRQAAALRETLSGNDPALLLVQGLQALGSYISDEKVNAHPDAFTLLHSFFEGLMLLLGDEELSTEKRQEILIERVSRLNALKEIIAGKTEAAPLDRGPVDAVDQILDLETPESEPEIETPVAEPEAVDESFPEDIFETPGAGEGDNALDFDFDLDETEKEQPAAVSNASEDEAVASLSDEEEFSVDFDIEQTAAHADAAMETADEQYPEDILDPSAIQPVSDEIADEFIEEELRLSSGVTPTPADSAESTDDFSMADKGLSKEQLDEELELIFSDEEGGEDLSLSSSTDDDVEDFELSFDEEIEDEADTSPALDLSEALTDASKSDDSGLDFDDDLFLSDDDDDQLATADEELVTPALADADEDENVTGSLEPSELGEEPAADLEGKLDSLFGSSENTEPEPALDEEESFTPALEDADEEAGFNEEVVAEGIADGPSEELEGKLDSFFGISEEEPDIDNEPALVEEDTEVMVDDSVVAALSDAEEKAEGGFREEEVVAELSEDPSEALQDKLDSFFGSDDEEPADSSTAAVEPALAEEELDSFFAEEDSTIAPALAGSDETTGFNEDEEGSDVAQATKGELDSNLDSFFAEDNEETDSNAGVISAIGTLAAVAARVASSPASAELQELAQLVTAQKEENPTTQQTVILNLLEAAAALLAKNEQGADGSGAIIQELATALDAGDDTAMLQAVTSYTSWQQDFFDRVAAAQPVVSTPAGLNEDVALQVKDSFSQLRASLEAEFAALRKEFTKK